MADKKVKKAEAKPKAQPKAEPKPKPPARKKAPFKYGRALVSIGGCHVGDFVALSEESEIGLFFGKFISGHKEGVEFVCPAAYVAEVEIIEEVMQGKVPNIHECILKNA